MVLPGVRRIISINPHRSKPGTSQALTIVTLPAALSIFTSRSRIHGYGQVLTVSSQINKDHITYSCWAT